MLVCITELSSACTLLGSVPGCGYVTRYIACNSRVPPGSSRVHPGPSLHQWGSRVVEAVGCIQDSRRERHSEAAAGALIESDGVSTYKWQPLPGSGEYDARGAEPATNSLARGTRHQASAFCSDSVADESESAALLQRQRLVIWHDDRPTENAPNASSCVRVRVGVHCTGALYCRVGG